MLKFVWLNNYLPQKSFTINREEITLFTRRSEPGSNF